MFLFITDAQTVGQQLDESDSCCKIIDVSLFGIVITTISPATNNTSGSTAILVCRSGVILNSHHQRSVTILFGRNNSTLNEGRLFSLLGQSDIPGAVTVCGRIKVSTVTINYNSVWTVPIIISTKINDNRNIGKTH